MKSKRTRHIATSAQAATNLSGCKAPAPSRKMKRGDYAKARVVETARSMRGAFVRFCTGFTPGAKRTGAGTSCPHSKKGR